MAKIGGNVPLIKQMIVYVIKLFVVNISIALIKQNPQTLHNTGTDLSRHKLLIALSIKLL